MSEREFDTQDHSQELKSARMHDSLYAEILLRCGMFGESMVPGGDETELRELVGMFLAGRAGIELERAHDMADEIVPYYDGYARHRMDGKIALDIIPTIFSRAVIDNGLAGNTETMSQLLTAQHYSLLNRGPLGFLKSNIEVESKKMISMRLMAAAESLSVATGEDVAQQRLYFKQTVGTLENRQLIEPPQRTQLIRYASTGRIHSLPFRLFGPR